MLSKTTKKEEPREIAPLIGQKLPEIELEAGE